MLVGHQRLDRYTRAIREQVQELTSRGCTSSVRSTSADLAAMFRSADAVVTASEHEGFCLPLLEAMTFEKPIVARGLRRDPRDGRRRRRSCCPPYEGPALFAEAVAELLANEPLAASWSRGGSRRLAELERHPPDVAVVEALLEVV